ALSFHIHSLAPTALSPLSLHDALPILQKALTAAEQLFDVGRVQLQPRGAAVVALAGVGGCLHLPQQGVHFGDGKAAARAHRAVRSEEHTSELQSRENLVCRLLLEKKKK